MYPLDNGKAEYTWKEEWNFLYESSWGRIEKFRTINVMEPPQMDKIIRIGPNSGIDARFSSELLIFRNQAFKINNNLSFLNIDNSIFSTFTGMDGLFDNRIRYCPDCMQNGYHSFLHQLTVMDNCFIHNATKLKYRCSCTYTYILSRKKAQTKIYQCEFCNAEIADFGSIYDCIITDLWNDKRYKALRLSQCRLQVNILDFYYIAQGSKRLRTLTNLNMLQRDALRELILNGESKCQPRFVIKKKVDGAESPCKLIISKALNQYLTEHYEYDIIVEHYLHVSARYRRYDIENFNIEILTILYLLKELQCVDAVDQLPYQYTVQNDKSISSLFETDNNYSRIVGFIELYLFRFMHIKEEDYIEAYNVILKELVLSRYNHIYSCFQGNIPEEYPCTSMRQVSYRNWEYPSFVVIKNENEDILIY